MLPPDCGRHQNRATQAATAIATATRANQRQTESDQRDSVPATRCRSAHGEATRTSAVAAMSKARISRSQRAELAEDLGSAANMMTTDAPATTWQLRCRLTGRSPRQNAGWV